MRLSNFTSKSLELEVLNSVSFHICAVKAEASYAKSPLVSLSLLIKSKISKIAAM